MFLGVAPPGTSKKTLEMMDTVLMDTFLEETNRNGDGSWRLRMEIINAGRTRERSGNRNQTRVILKSQGVLDALHRRKQRYSVDGHTGGMFGRLGRVGFRTHKLVFYRGAACEKTRNAWSLSSYWREIQSASGSQRYDNQARVLPVIFLRHEVSRVL